MAAKQAPSHTHLQCELHCIQWFMESECEAVSLLLQHIPHMVICSLLHNLVVQDESLCLKKDSKHSPT